MGPERDRPRREAAPVGYLATIIASPINGLVTGIFCDLGDCVQAGQPIVTLV
jgi:multidrug resistance efflux pump